MKYRVVNMSGDRSVPKNSTEHDHSKQRGSSFVIARLTNRDN